MKKFDIKKKHTSKGVSRRKLRTSFKRTLGMMGRESNLASSLQVSAERPKKTFPNYDELQKVNAQLLKMEMQKDQAIQLIRDHNRCV